MIYMHHTRSYKSLLLMLFLLLYHRCYTPGCIYIFRAPVSSAYISSSRIIPTVLTLVWMAGGTLLRAQARQVHTRRYGMHKVMLDPLQCQHLEKTITTPQWASKYICQVRGCTLTVVECMSIYHFTVFSLRRFQASPTRVPNSCWSTDSAASTSPTFMICEEREHDMQSVSGALCSGHISWRRRNPRNGPARVGTLLARHITHSQLYTHSYSYTRPTDKQHRT